MNLSVNYHNGTDTISLKLSRTPGAVGAVGIVTTQGTINVEMGVKEWLEVIGEVRKAIIKVQHGEMPEQQPADLAAKIAEHGCAT